MCHVPVSQAVPAVVNGSPAKKMSFIVARSISDSSIRYVCSGQLVRSTVPVTRDRNPSIESAMSVSVTWPPSRS